MLFHFKLDVSNVVLLILNIFADKINQFGFSNGIYPETLGNSCWITMLMAVPEFCCKSTREINFKTIKAFPLSQRRILDSSKRPDNNFEIDENAR